ncbi:MAG: hypothetical protein AAF840_18890, partial [Bacteroidota bacterium]
TAILFLPPGASPSEFVILAVAGGGGGAYSNCCTIKYKGRSAEAGTSGSNGRCSDTDLAFPGGTNGNGGGGGGDGSTGAGGGGGAFTPGQGECVTCQGGAGGGTDDPYGGRGGFLQAQSANQGGLYGGYGYGAGGQGYNRNGGGGGGYSGGGNCETEDLNFGGGGGGGSYINEAYATDITKIKNPETRHSINGYIDYAFEWCYSINIATGTSPAACDAPYSGRVAVLVNPCTVLSDIQLSSGTDTFTPTSFGTTGNVVTFSDLPAGNYRVQEMRGVHLIKEWGTVTITGNGDTQAPQLSCVGTEVGAGNDFNLALGDTLTLTIDDIITDVSDNCGLAELALYRDDTSDPVNNPPSLV